MYHSLNLTTVEWSRMCPSWHFSSSIATLFSWHHLKEEKTLYKAPVAPFPVHLHHAGGLVWRRAGRRALATRSITGHTACACSLPGGSNQAAFSSAGTTFPARLPPTGKYTTGNNLVKAGAALQHSGFTEVRHKSGTVCCPPFGRTLAQFG